MHLEFCVKGSSFNTTNIALLVVDEKSLAVGCSCNIFQLESSLTEIIQLHTLEWNK